MLCNMELNAEQVVSTEFRSQGSRAQSVQVLSGLNHVDTNWLAFECIISIQTNLLTHFHLYQLVLNHPLGKVPL